MASGEAGRFNSPVYSFFPNVKRPRVNAQAAQYSRTHIALVARLLGGFSLHYVPSAKSVNQIYSDLLTPFLRSKVAKVLEPHLPDIAHSLKEAADALNAELRLARLSEYEASFSLPRDSFEALVSGFDFMISDPNKTPISQKGMGIQTTALLAAFRWISRQEALAGREALWLLEEPESYLHPDLADNCNAILENLAEDSTVVKTTHSMAFVPQNPLHVSGTRLNEKNRTEVQSYKTFNESVSAIRTALGIKFSDFYNLAQFNVLVEGPSDRELFEWMISKLPASSHPMQFVRQAKFEDFGGVKHLSGFLRATYQFIRKEHPCVAVFDGDEAGEKERRDLQGYFGRIEVPFEANKQFVSVRSGFAIEGLFPDKWIESLYAEHGSWFETFSVDAEGRLEPFKIKDGKKANAQAALVAMADAEGDLKWAAKFIKVLQVIDSALENLHEGLRKGE